jgi:RNA polymerase sigma factor (sigma-70 family)
MPVNTLPCTLDPVPPGAHKPDTLAPRTQKTGAVVIRFPAHRSAGSDKTLDTLFTGSANTAPGMSTSPAALPLGTPLPPPVGVLAEDHDTVDGVDEGFDGYDDKGDDTASEPASRSGIVACADDPQLASWIATIVRQDGAGQHALAALYDATCHRVHGLALRIVQRPALAEEVVEDTFWQVWRQAPRFDATRGRPLTWLLAMARSRAIDALRRDQRFRHDELADDDLSDAGSAAPPPQDLLDATRGRAALHAALLKIDTRSRQLVALAFFRGWSHEQIAEQQQMPLGTVKSLIRRALISLRQQLETGDAR